MSQEKENTHQQITDFESLIGKCIQGKVDGHKFNVISPGAVSDYQKNYDEAQFQNMSEEGKTAVFAMLDDVLIGMIALADIVRDTAKKAVADLKQKKIHSVMRTGGSH